CASTPASVLAGPDLKRLHTSTPTSTAIFCSAMAKFQTQLMATSAAGHISGRVMVSRLAFLAASELTARLSLDALLRQPVGCKHRLSFYSLLLTPRVA